MACDDEIPTGTGADAGADADVLEALRTGWGLRVDQLTPLDGGMNSRTWRVRPDVTGDDSERPAPGWVAKLVRSDQHDTSVRGLHAAALVQAAGIPAGAPVPTRTGADHVHLAGGALALLSWVDGDPLTGHQDGEQTLIGATLGAAHRVLREAADETAADFPAWVDVDADHLDVQDWVRPAVRAALQAYRDLDHDHLELGLLHADPEPGAFLRDPQRSGGMCGLIDWSSSEQGPLPYDLASALMYVGGPLRGRALLVAHADAVCIPVTDLEAQVEVLLTLRQAVQADCFARRLATGDLTGIRDARENWHGLHAAESHFQQHR